MSVLILYGSTEGHTRSVAEALARSLRLNDDRGPLEILRNHNGAHPHSSNLGGPTSSSRLLL
jgi:menaquinone-dependent protoporphyrinogen IX oxidase